MGFMDKLSEVNDKMGKTIQESLESTLNFDLKPKDGKMHPLIVAMKGFISIKNFTTGIKVDSRRVDYLDRVRGRCPLDFEGGTPTLWQK